MGESRCDYGTFVVTMKIRWLLRVLLAVGLDKFTLSSKSNLTLRVAKGRKHFDSEPDAIDI
jgi:hypothetical protein